MPIRPRPPCPSLGKYFSVLGSILPVGDITASVAREDADVAILEEPEHVRARDLGSGAQGLGFELELCGPGVCRAPCGSRGAGVCRWAASLSAAWAAPAHSQCPAPPSHDPAPQLNWCQHKSRWTDKFK